MASGKRAARVAIAWALALLACVGAASAQTNYQGQPDTWTAQQTFVAPILGTPASATLTNATGLPVSTGLAGAGTGVISALGDNVGSAGAIVINGGALGTPSSGTLTNATGLPISTGVSGLGTGVATALGNAVNGASGLSNVDGSLTTGHCLEWGPGIQDAGGACTTSSGANLTVGSTVISSGTSGDIEYDNAGVLGEKGVTGTGSVVLATSPTLVTPALGAATGTSLAIGGATLGSNALAVTGLGNFASAGSASAPTLSVGNQTTGFYSVSTTGYGISVNGTSVLDYGVTTASTWTTTSNNVTIGQKLLSSGSSLQLGNSGSVTWQFYNNQLASTNSSQSFSLDGDTILSRHAAANWQFGAADAASPVAQTIGVQSVVAGTSNGSGVNRTETGSVSTGSGTSGDIIFQTGGTGASATAQNSLVTALTIKGGTQQVNFADPFQVSSSSTGSSTQTFTNSPCSGLTAEQWVPVKISGQSGTWYVPACQ